MRIRKNAKLSPSWFSHASAPEALQTHVCQLNQSPWDAIPFAQDSSQLGGEDSFTGNASLADSIGAVDSVSSMMDAVAAKAEEMVVYDNDKLEKRPKAFDYTEERARENEFGFQNTNNNNNNITSSTSPSFRRAPAAAAAAAAAAGARRARARAANSKKGSSSSNPYEFYYYSGFGPLWGRKRGDRGGGGAADVISKSNEAAKLVDSVTIIPLEAAVLLLPPHRKSITMTISTMRMTTTTTKTTPTAIAGRSGCGSR
ncbi:hypothetical protein SLA2020_350990 [Shorea laevis]